jgi:beta-lactam-binding protein with PASTA domain/predicted Ser/Thr protein kinase
VSPDSTSGGASEGHTLIGGRYALGELLGRGGMAEVRKGTDARLGRTVAVKRLRTDLASDLTFQARFRREAQSAASLNHPAIVAVYDTGEEPAEDGSGISQPYIVMEFVAGRTLRDILREGRKILPERALEITSGVLSALDYSHRAGIIHRDIKPGNVMLTPSGDVKVMDFGIARAISDASSTMTQTAAVVGTAQYLSPEQARGESVDARSDVYSAGCLLYELLAGRPPFLGDSPVAVAYQHVREQAAPPSDHDTDLPPEVDAIVMKSLAKRVEDRYQSAAAMRGDIERHLAGHAVHVTAPPPPVEPPTTITQTAPVISPVPPPQHEEYEPEERGTRPGLLVFLGIVLLIVLGLAAYLLPKMFASPSDQVQVPRLAGLSENQARSKLADAGLEVATPDHAYSTKVASNRVISQNPPADDFVDKGTTVTFTLSLGTHPTKVPSIVGLTRSAAASALKAAHLQGVFKKVDSDQPQGTVVSTEPTPGTQVGRNSDVTVNLSLGAKTVPNVVGLTQDQAEQKLKAAGFNPQASPDNSSTEPKGTVTGQTPSQGTPLPQGQSVFITVSQYEPPSTPPTSPSSSPPSSPTSPGTSSASP